VKVWPGLPSKTAMKIPTRRPIGPPASRLSARVDPRAGLPFLLWALTSGPLAPGTAAAAPPPGGYQDDDDGPTSAPPPPPAGQPAPAPPPPEPVPAAQPVATSGQPPGATPAPEPMETRSQGRGLQYGFHLVVPVFVSANDAAEMRPGIGIQGRIGWEFPTGLSIEGILGVSYNGSNSDAVFEDISGATTTVGDYGLTNIWFGAGLRYAFINATALVPFVGAGLHLNVWTDVVTFEDGSSLSSDRSELSLGAQLNGGLIFEVNQNIGVEVGLIVNWTDPPDSRDFGEPVPFAEPRVWLSPFAGLTLYF